MSKAEILKNFAHQVLEGQDYSFAEAILEDNLVFVPIVKTEIPKDERDYLTIDEAIDEGILQIQDKGTEIAHILAKNTGNEPILIEEGEILAGEGTQDRIVVGSIILQPMSVVELPVKCVHAPHFLSAGSGFLSSSKSSRGMLRQMRGMKKAAAESGLGSSSISQEEVWSNVQKETSSDDTVRDKTHYRQTIGTDLKRASTRKIDFPKNTIGVIVFSEEEKVVGMEIHRTPRVFQRRKISLMTSLEREYNKEKSPLSSKRASERSNEVFTQLSSLETESVNPQIEVDGLLFELEKGVQGEYVTNKFYSDSCPQCGKKKARIAVCSECEYEEEGEESLTYLSLM